jgi:hypothetical protein
MVYDGNREIKLHRSLSKIPVLAKEGTILPLDSSPITSHGVQRPTHVDILLVVGADAEFDLYEEDDTVPPAIGLQKGAFTHTLIKWCQKTGTLTITSNRPQQEPKRQWSVRLVGAHVKTDVRDHESFFVLGELSDNGQISRTFGGGLELDIVDIPGRLHEMLYRCEMDYQMKEVIWKLVTEDPSPVHVRMAKLYDLDIDSVLRDTVVEIWFADERALTAMDGGSRGDTYMQGI